MVDCRTSCSGIETSRRRGVRAIEDSAAAIDNCDKTGKCPLFHGALNGIGDRALVLVGESRQEIAVARKSYGQVTVVRLNLIELKPQSAYACVYFTSREVFAVKEA